MPNQPSDFRTVNDAFLNKISGDPSMVKQAEDAVNDFTRVQMREEGIFRQVLPMVAISDDELDRQVDTDKPVKIVDKEPGSPAAVSIPLGTNPSTRYMRAPRYRVDFARISTPKMTKDVDELRSYNLDVRQIFSDNMLKDLLAEEDTKWIRACNAVMAGRGTTVTETGGVHWAAVTGAVSRSGVLDALKIGPSLRNRIETKTVLVNNITIKDIEKYGRIEAGGDLSERLLTKGFSSGELFGRQWLVTIKQDLVPTGTLFMFAEPNKLGKSYVITDTSMFIQKTAWIVEFFAYELIGAAIGNVAGVARADFATTSYTPTGIY